MRKPWKRQTSLGVGAGLFLTLMVFAFGAFTPGSAASFGEANGPAVLISWTADTVLDLGFVAIWLLAAYGYGSLFRYGRERFRVRAATGFMRASGDDRTGIRNAGESSDARPHPDRLPSSTTGEETGAGDRLFHVVTLIALGIGVVGFLTLALGLAGVLNRGTALAILFVGVGLPPWRRAASVRPWLTGRSGSCMIGTGVAAVLSGIMVPLASLPPGMLWRPLDPHPYDVVSYHLQVPREWYELGRVAPLPHNAFSYFPMGQEMHTLLAMHALGGPWAAMYVAQLISVAFAGLTVLAVVGIVRRTDMRAWAWPAGLFAAYVPWTLMLGTVAYVESGVMLYGVLAVAWAAGPLSRCTQRERVRVRASVDKASDSPNSGEQFSTAEHKANALTLALSRAYTGEGTGLLLAGVCAGLAGGIKLTALAMTAAPVFVLWPIVAGRRFRLRPWLIGVAACGLAVSPWLVRNAVWTGNPVFPVATSLFGTGPFTADQSDRFRVAHAPPLAEQSLAARATAGWQRVVVDPQSAYFLVPLAVAGVAFGLRDPAGRFVGGVLVATTLVWLLATHDMPRFLAPAIPLAAVTIGLWPRRKWATAVVATGVVATAAAGVVWTAWTAGPFVADGRRGLFRVNDLSALLPADVQDVYKNGGKLALVGDAQAFFYPFPAGRLKYRGVFDVVVPPGVTLADGWLGEPVERLRAEGWWVYVSPAELARLASTYRHLPPPAAPFADGPPVLLPPTGP